MLICLSFLTSATKSIYGLSQFKSNHSGKSSLKIDGAKGLKLSLNLIFKLSSFCIFSDLGSAKIDLPPKALGPNSILP